MRKLISKLALFLFASVNCIGTPADYTDNQTYIHAFQDGLATSAFSLVILDIIHSKAQSDPEYQTNNSNACLKVVLNSLNAVSRDIHLNGPIGDISQDSTQQILSNIRQLISNTDYFIHFLTNNTNSSSGIHKRDFDQEYWDEKIIDLVKVRMGMKPTQAISQYVIDHPKVQTDLLYQNAGKSPYNVINQFFNELNDAMVDEIQVGYRTYIVKPVFNQPVVKNIGPQQIHSALTFSHPKFTDYAIEVWWGMGGGPNKAYGDIFDKDVVLVDVVDPGNHYVFKKPETIASLGTVNIEKAQTVLTSTMKLWDAKNIYDSVHTNCNLFNEVVVDQFIQLGERLKAFPSTINLPARLGARFAPLLNKLAPSLKIPETKPDIKLIPDEIRTLIGEHASNIIETKMELGWTDGNCLTKRGSIDYRTVNSHQLQIEHFKNIQHLLQNRLLVEVPVLCFSHKKLCAQALAKTFWSTYSNEILNLLISRSYSDISSWMRDLIFRDIKFSSTLNKHNGHHFVLLNVFWERWKQLLSRRIM